MLQLGFRAPEPREMILDDIFFLRLKLLLRMAMDYFEGRAFSDLRRQIVVDNARFIQSESMELGGIQQTRKSEPDSRSGQFDSFFFQRAYQLALLMERAAKKEPLNDQHKLALQESFQAIRHIQHTTYYEDLLPGYMN